MVETQGAVRQADISGGANGHADGAHTAMLEQKLAQARKDYHDVLERNLSEGDVEEVKRELYSSLASEQQNGERE